MTPGFKISYTIHLYLGIELIYDLKWEKHVTNIVAKTSRTLGMLFRVLKMADTATGLHIVKVGKVAHTPPRS